MTGAPTQPTQPIELTGHGERLAGVRVPVDAEVLARLGAVCETLTAPDVLAEASRDWWPLALHWALAGEVPAAAAALCRPTSADQVAAILRLANDERIPVTPAGGRSGVCGASVPVHGGILLDLTAMQGVESIDDTSLVVEVLPGTFGPDYEAHLREHGFTGGH
ncbi:MAG TPA: FAD-dependent oxidoreductase, partial [Ilumatobacteraceae bacterium]